MTATGELQIGIGLPNFGETLADVDARGIAQTIEELGLDSAWVTDHVMLPERYDSRYPYAADGSFFLPEGGHWYEALTTLAHLSGATERIGLGIGVCVLPLRDPRLFSQQIATLDRLSGGRAVLGVGAGWLTEEFAALEVPSERRGARLEAAIEVMRACWTGAPQSGSYGPYTLPDGFMARPTPVQERLPILLAGGGERSLRRIVTHGDGWYGAIGAGTQTSADEIASVVRRLGELCAEHGRDPAALTHGLRLAPASRELGSDELSERLHALVEVGIGLLTIDFGWPSLAKGRERLERLGPAVSALRAGREDRGARS